MTSDDLCFTAATELASLIRRRRVSPLEITQAALERIARVNPAVTAYCTVAAEQALEAATEATAAVKRRGARLGPLHGVPVSIKDLTPTKGIRTTWGSKIFEHHVPEEDGLVVQRLKEAGAIVIGKTNTPEFGAGANPSTPSSAPRAIRESRAHLRRLHGGGARRLALGSAPSPRARTSRLPAPARAFCGRGRLPHVHPASCPCTPPRWRGTA